LSERRSKYAGLRDSSTDTEVRGSVSTEVRKETSEEASAPVREEVSTEVSTQGRREAGKDLRQSVRAGIRERKHYPGGVKLTLEIHPDLNTRAKRFLLDNGCAPVRHLLCELLEEFLEGEGY
jgi:hypothetical protein